MPFENRSVVESAGEAAEGVIFPSHFDPDAALSSVQEYQRKYLARYGHRSEGFAMLAYDGLKVLAGMLKTCPHDKDCQRKYVLSGNFDGVTGPFHFDSMGSSMRPIVVKEYKKDRFVIAGSEKLPRPR